MMRRRRRRKRRRGRGGKGEGGGGRHIVITPRYIFNSLYKERIIDK